MSKLITATIAGLIFGAVDVLLMIPIPMEKKLTALTASFINRFAIGFFTTTVDLPVPLWVKGLIIGLLLSLPDAIITRVYVPILVIGVVGGMIVALATKPY
ncbi:hypothetical protein M1523_03355 [Patescibacteria group bacterium]|nr:hypothetical protein [Patescibacteria group bacterium]MCL5091241.1 hypothetical protein [Patescibacteria group bacterium]